MKNRYATPIVVSLIAMAMLTSAFLVPIATVQASWYTMEMRMVYVKITSGGGGRSSYQLRQTYGGSWYEARGWYLTQYGIPADAWKDDSMPYEFETFDTLTAFKLWWANNPSATEGLYYYVDAEEHIEYSNGYYINFGQSRGSIFGQDLSGYQLVRRWNPTTHVISNLTPFASLTLMKLALAGSLGMEVCWYGALPWVNCLMEGYGGFDPDYCTDFCWLCYNQLYNIKSWMGWS